MTSSAKRVKRSTTLTSLVNVLKHSSNDSEEQHSLNFVKTSETILTGDKEGFKGCKWAPDGTCLLTVKDKYVKLFEVNKEDDNRMIREVVNAREAETVYDYVWYPNMDSTDPATCCFATISRSSPIHLWDAYQSNLLRASYTLRDDADEPVWGLSIGLTSTQVYCGLNSAVYCTLLSDIYLYICSD